MKRWAKEALGGIGWALAIGGTLAAIWLMLHLSGCAAARETAKQDLKLAQDFTACDADAKKIAQTAPSCADALARLVELMSQPECEGFPSAPMDGGIAIGGVTYICHEEARDGR